MLKLTKMVINPAVFTRSTQTMPEPLKCTVTKKQPVGGGQPVFQRRLDGSVDFFLGWDDYKRGFGNLSGEFWLGLDKIHQLTKEQSKLRVDLEDFSGNTSYAEYSSFGVGDEGSKYKLSLGAYLGKYFIKGGKTIIFNRLIL